MQKNKTHTNSYLIKQLPDAVVFLNRKMEIIYASDKLSTDFELSTSNVIGENFFTTFPYLSTQCQNAIRDSITGKNYKVKKEYYFNNDESYKWVEWSSAPWYDEDENIIGVIVKLENVDDTTNIELELKKTKDLLEETATTGKIGTWEYKIKEDILKWSNMTKQIHGVSNNYKPSIQTAIKFYKRGYSRKTIKEKVQNSLKDGKPWSEKLQIITADGREIWIIASGKPIFKKDKLIGIFGTFNDVNDIVNSEIKIKKSEELLRTLIDHLPINVFIKDINSKKIVSNKHDTIFSKVLGSDEVIGKNDFHFCDEETAKKNVKEDREVINSRIPVLAKEKLIIKKDGTKSIMLTSKIPLIENNGEVNKLVGFSVDITDIKEKEKELKKLINVTSLQNERLINFAHIISHNLRSQTANFSMLLDFLVKETNEIEKKSITNMLISTSEKLLDTLQTLNEVVIINTNVTLEKKPICLSNKISSIEKELFPLLNSNKAIIINEVPKSVYINVSENYLDDILKNMIENSVKYKHKDRSPIIKLSTKKNEDYITLNIEDNGIGIDLKKYGDKIFGMHKTFHNNNDTKGIDLYIIKNQIEAMNGKITVSSIVNEGTIFNIYFNEKD